MRLQRDKIPILRRFSGGGTVYHVLSIIQTILQFNLA